MSSNQKARAKGKHDQMKKTGGGPNPSMTVAEDLILDHFQKTSSVQLNGLDGGLDFLDCFTIDNTAANNDAEPDMFIDNFLDEGNLDLLGEMAVPQARYSRDYDKSKRPVESRKRMAEDDDLIALEKKRIQAEI